jgi:hypothetical protein
MIETATTPLDADETGRPSETDEEREFRWLGRHDRLPAIRWMVSGGEQ